LTERRVNWSQQAGLFPFHCEHGVMRSQLGLRFIPLAAGSVREIEGIFATLQERQIEAMLVSADGFFFGLQDELIPLAARHTVPMVFPLSDYVAAGGLISYGANLAESWRQTGIYVGKRSLRV
jgi:putative ABC transport system substrate-binding protein